MSKKNLIINCDICDARRADEESLSGYERILVNADLLLVDKKSKAILNRLPVTYNTDRTLEMEGEVNPMVINGNYAITEDSALPDNTLLVVNGTLRIHPHAEESMKKIRQICVNGTVKYPESMAASLGCLLLNGGSCRIPDGCLELEDVFSIDAYFPLRAKNGAQYYAKNKVLLTDPEVDVLSLAQKKIHFKTERFVCRQEMLEASIGMFDENVRLQVVPAGYAYVGQDAVLDSALLQKYGTRLYIDGNLTLPQDGQIALSRIEKLTVVGKVHLSADQKDAFLAADVQYGDIVVETPEKGKKIENKSSVTVDQALLDACPGGLSIHNAMTVTVKEDVRAESILDLLSIKNCAQLICAPAQRSALELVSQNVAHIGEGGGNAPDIIKDLLQSNLINADCYVL